MFDMKLGQGDLELGRLDCLAEYLHCDEAYYLLAQGLVHGWHSAVPVKGGSPLLRGQREKNHQLKLHVSHKKKHIRAII